MSLRALANTYLENKAKKKFLLNSKAVIESSSEVCFRKISTKANNCTLQVGTGSMIHSSIVFEKANACITVGDNTFMGGSTLSCATKIKIGNNVQLAWGGIIFDHDSHSLNYLDRRGDLPNTFKGLKDWSNVATSEVVIEDDVWIGANVILLKGIRIGYGSIIGAGSVVTKCVPPMSLYAGNPCKFIKDL